MKIALGTVQFGLDYGISNRDGIVASDEVTKILATATKNGIDTLDTGCVYGKSEDVLGQTLSKMTKPFKVIDKIPDLETLGEPIDVILERSLNNLGISHLEGLLLHNAADLNDSTFTQLSKLKAQGLIKKIGISVYYPSQTFDLIRNYDIDIIQCPLNLFDQRFAQTGCIETLKQQGIEIHARSLFLQGLLLMSPSDIPSYFAPYMNLFERLRSHCRGHDIDHQTAALTIAHQQTLVDKFVIGVCSTKQLLEVITAFNHAATCDFEIADFSCHEEALISPFLWPQRQ